MQLGQIPIVSLRFHTSWKGPWVADCDLVLGDADPTPSGPQTMIVGTRTLIGTVDDRATFRFGERARVRVVAGRGAWNDEVDAQQFQNDAGVSSRDVVTATASTVGETVVDPNPVTYDTSYTRRSGKASDVFSDRQWYVDLAGVTQVADWPTASLSDHSEFLAYDPTTRVAQLSTDDLVLPGTKLFDFRTGDALIVRTTDQAFGEAGSKCFAFVSLETDDAQDRLGALLDVIGSEFSGVEWARVYRYAIASQANGVLTLKRLDPSTVMPETVKANRWPGIPGATAIHVPGTQCLLAFINGDRSRPAIVSFDGDPPTEFHLDAVTLIQLGAGAVSFAARGDTAASVLSALVVFGTSAPTTLPQVIAAIAALGVALTPPALVTPAACVKVKLE